MPDYCKHELPYDECSICRDPKTVWISSGGMAYHYDQHCDALEAGRDKVVERGGVQGEVRPTTRSNAEAEGRGACHTCG